MEVVAQSEPGHGRPEMRVQVPPASFTLGDLMSVLELHKLLSISYTSSFSIAQSQMPIGPVTLRNFFAHYQVTEYPKWHILQKLFRLGLPPRPSYVSTQTMLNLFRKCIFSAPSLWKNTGGTVAVQLFICYAAVRYLKDDPA